MARAKFIIRSILKINNSNGVGVIIEDSTQSVRRFKEIYDQKKAVLKNNEQKKEGLITALDGYKSNTSIKKVNLIFILDIENIDEFSVGDTIEVEV